MRDKRYSLEELIEDESFQQWVFCPDDTGCRDWDLYLLHYPDERETVEEARRVLMGIRSETVIPGRLVERMKTNFNTAIDEYEARLANKGNDRGGSNGNSSRNRWVWYSLAACLLVIAVTTGALYLEEGLPGDMLHHVAWEKHKAPPGMRRQIDLPDGTRVWLNAGSELRYPAAFSGTLREVFLEGEAFFDVVDNASRPFVVHAAGLDIKVLGTSFNVRSYASESVVETTLIEGKVSIASSGSDSLQHVTLLPNQKASYRKDLRTIALGEVEDAGDYTGWKNGWMIFDDKPFSYIKETLERWYDVEIVMEDERSLTCTFSGKFKDKTLQEVLDIFKNTEAINYRIDGDQVFISGRLCLY